MYKTHFQGTKKFIINIIEQTLFVTKDDLSLHHFSLINIKITPLGPRKEESGNSILWCAVSQGFIRTSVLGLDRGDGGHLIQTIEEKKKLRPKNFDLSNILDKPVVEPG